MTVRWTSQPPLRRPALVAAFEGWNDAGDAASDAVRWLGKAFGADEFAHLEAEQYFDFQAARPSVALVDGVVRRLVWPGLRFLAARVPDGTRDLVLLVGVEPNLRWRGFCDDVLSVARSLGCTTALTLGALLADVPHSRPVRCTGSATDPRLASRLSMQRSRYEGPTGIVGVLHDALRQAGYDAASVWAPVPHYVATPPNPKATRALLERARLVLELDLDLTDLDIAASAWERTVAEVVAGDTDVSAYVSNLEQRFDSGGDDPEVFGSDNPFGLFVEGDDDGEDDDDDDEFDEDDLPSGDTLAADFERYLREHGDDTGTA